ncbi:hypothetical protein SAE02_76180 [Skermanella aerolata]|uniref:Uncharacterized protein n=1 Tax=Skermanella aerolata TaxID=393310 RepID=A0A512E4R2_9PROT|nr:hypothetical protein [Skermanella aerolata]GEO43470.1 hypothetical protein SAE02_76180 [Skermanella aerolata]
MTSLVDDTTTTTSFDDINGNWSDVQRFLNSRMRGGTDLDSLSRSIDANARAAQIEIFGGEVIVPATEQNRGTASAPTRGGTVVRAFWWGFHIQISHEDVQGVVSAIDGAKSLISAISPAAPAKVRPFLTLAQVFLDASKAILEALDRGSGVYISMSWFAPGVFVPTSVV